METTSDLVIPANEEAFYPTYKEWKHSGGGKE